MAGSSPSPETVLTLIRGAAQGRDEDRSQFCHRYLPVVRSYLRSRWSGTEWITQVDDAVQEVFLECLRNHGALESYDAQRGAGFRGFLFGVVRHVAQRIERTRGRRSRREPEIDSRQLADLQDRDASPSRVFDREWALSVMQQAREVMHASALLGGEKALRRYELLRMRFEEGLPVREIAARFREDPSVVHRAYRKARLEFRASLEQAVNYHCAGSVEEVRAESERLLAMLGSE